MEKLPKSIYKKNGKFQVNFTSKKYKNPVYCGIYSTLEEAIKERDKFIADNIDDLLFGYMPRGVSYLKTIKKYRAYLRVEEHVISIGQFNDLQSAIKKRNEYINSLK